MVAMVVMSDIWSRCLMGSEPSPSCKAQQAQALEGGQRGRGAALQARGQALAGALSCFVDVWHQNDARWLLTIKTSVIFSDLQARRERARQVGREASSLCWKAGEPACTQLTLHSAPRACCGELTQLALHL